MAIETYERPVINYVWFVHIRREPGGCRILLHDRMHMHDPKRPAVQGEFELIEQKTGRIVDKIILTPEGMPPETLVVLNSQNIFSYSRFND